MGEKKEQEQFPQSWQEDWLIGQQLGAGAYSR